jgi:hypothetical protein
MKKFLFLLFIFMSIGADAASTYKAGLGLRIEGGRDGNEGVTYKHFITTNTALEGLFMSDWDNGIEISALYLYQAKFPGAPNELMWYAGAGAHVGFWGMHDRNDKNHEDDDDTVIGPDGLIGIEYAFSQIPLAVSFDWHPVYNIVTKNDEHFWPMKFGIVLRYTF